MYRRLSSLRIFETVTLAGDRRLNSLRYLPPRHRTSYASACVAQFVAAFETH
jgi:hypothetical protein